MFYRVIVSLLSVVVFSGAIAMEQPAPSPAIPAPVDHLMNRLDRLIRQDKGNEIISMYEEHAERRAAMRDLVQQKKPLLIKAFDAVEQAERKHQASQQQERDAFDVLREQAQLPKPSAPEPEPATVRVPSAPELDQMPVRAPDRYYQDILIPQAPMPQPRSAAGQSEENQVVERFLHLTPLQKDAALEDLVQRRDVITLKALQQKIPGFRKINEALELIEVMRKSAHAHQQPQPAGKKLDDDPKPGDVQDSQNSVAATMRTVRDVVAQNPVETAVVAAGVVGLLTYVWKNSQSD